MARRHSNWAAEQTGSCCGPATVAGMLFLRHGRSATYHIGWSNADGKRGGAHNLLMWRAMQGLKAAGVRWLDLGGIATDHGIGLARFKLGTGATVRQLSGTYF